MKSTGRAIAGLFSSLLVLAGSVQAATVTIDGSRTYQVIEGFGVNANHRGWTNNELEPVLDALIDQAGMTLFRVVYDNTNWETNNESSDLSVLNQIYSSSPEFQALWGIMGYLNQKGITNGLMLNFQGPGPSWMGGMSLTPGYESDWAGMIASLLVYARKTNNLQFTLVGPNNEPDFINSGGIATTAAQYVLCLHDLAQLLDTNGLSDLRFVGPDLSATDTSWLTQMMSDPVVMGKVAHFGLHSYGPGGSAISSFLAGSAYPNLTFWMTEFNVWCDVCQFGGQGTNNWDYFRGTAEYLLAHLANNASAGFVWDGYDGIYRSNNSDTEVTSFWGLFAVNDINAVPKIYTPRKNFYTMSQITRFVRPGAKRIDVSGSVSLEYLLAFYNTNNGQLTLTGVNNSSAPTTFSGTLTSLPAVGSLELYYTDSTNNILDSATIPVNNRSFTATVPADCVFTLVGFNFALGTVSVVITNPLDGASYSAPANIPIGATASTSTGSVSRVEFFCGTTNLGEAVSPPYGITWRNVPAGSYVLTASATNSVGNFGVSSGVHVTVLGAPVITQQPQSQAVAAASTALFAVTASGVAPLSYQWLCSGTNLANGGQFSGATSPTLSLSNAQPSNTGGYSVVVTNVAGSVTSTVATLTVHVPGSCLSAPPGQVGWWPGDGNVQDIQGTNNGTLVGGATATAAGMVAQAFNFDGTNGYVRIPDSPALRPTNLTIEAWVLFTSLDSAGLGGAPPGLQYIVFKQNTRSSSFEGYYLGKERGVNGDFFGFGVSSSSGQAVEVNSVATITTGAWYHVAGVRGSNYIQLYVNGLLASQAIVSFPQDYGPNALYFATSGQAYWDRKLAGTLDEVSLYNRALAASEVAGIYAAGSAGKCRAHNAYRITPAGSPTAGSPCALTITAVDQYQNTVSTVTGDHSFTFAGLALADDGTYPTITDKNGNAVNLGTATTITFTNGVNSAGGSLLAYKGQTATLTGSDATSGKGTGDAGGTGASLTIANINPVAGADTETRAPNLSLKILKSKLVGIATDANHDVLSVSGVGATSTGGAALSTNATYVFYIPNGAGDGDTFTYTVSDRNGGAATGTVTVHVAVQPGGSSGEIGVSGGVASVKMFGIPGLQYDVQRTTNLSLNVWTTLTAAPPLNTAPPFTASTADGSFSFTDSFSDLGRPPASAYYRVMAH